MGYGAGGYGSGPYGLPLWMLHPNTGGVPVAGSDDPGALVFRAGQLQFGRMLLGSDTRAGWRDLVGWRDLPGAQVTDTPRPQAHGAYPGAVYADAATITFTFLVRGKAEAKAKALAAIERHTRMDGVERALVVHDGITAATMRRARVIGRQVPMGKVLPVGPVECSLQFLAADPRRYSLTEQVHTVAIPQMIGGLEYPLDYPLDYGTTTGGAVLVNNQGDEATPVVVTFHGPLVKPVLKGPGWSLAFNITLAGSESLVVDTITGAATVGGADRLYTIDPLSDPPEVCQLPAGPSTLHLAATSGSGSASVAFRHAYL